MARFGLILPRQEMVEPVGRIAAQLGMEVACLCWTTTEDLPAVLDRCRQAGADILVARGRQAQFIKDTSDFPLVEIRLTGQEMALLLHRARAMVPGVERPRVGLVTFPNMVEDVSILAGVLEVELHTYFGIAPGELDGCVDQAAADRMDVILGGDYVNALCRERGLRTLFFEGTEDSLRAALRQARSAGYAADSERRNTAHLQALLDCSFNGIIEMDPAGTILQVNDIAAKLLEKERRELVGQSAARLISAEDRETWEEVLGQQQEYYFPLLNLCGVDVVASVMPVTGTGAVEGIVFSFYEMKKFQRQEVRARQEHYRLHRYLARGRFEDVKNAGRELKPVIKLARAFAQTRLPVLIQGEVGSGKSLFAQSIHNASPCSGGPFVTYNCGGDWDDMGAGLAQAAVNAYGGTLYLDGLERLSSPEQHVLCRLLREGVVKLGDKAVPQPVTARVLASLVGSLSHRVAAGDFLPELYYLLAPMQLELPPLRVRAGDLNQAIDMCLDDCVKKFSRYIVLTKEARKLLLEYPWPGNYIQLQSFLERMVLSAPARVARDSYVQGLLQSLYPHPPAPAGEEDADPVPPEAALLLEALSRNNGSRAAAAEELGISKTTLWRKMKRYGLPGRYQ